MKKILLGAAMALMATIGNAQVICYVEAPSPNEGNYDFTYATGTTWACPDLTIPGNSVQGEMVFCSDGTAADSLACGTLTNDAAINGNIAVLYRGSCEFGLKAFNAQTAGAIGVIIINNAAGAPVAMGGGANGLSVTIPVIMVSNVTGALLKAEIEAGLTTVFIGSKNGLYVNDLGITSADYLRSKSFSNLQLLSQDASEFEVEIGTWVRNYGQNDQTGITLNCMIDLGASNVYNETSPSFSLLSGDSVFVSLPAFTQTSYANGYYDMAYTVMMPPLDESTYDNVREADFMINDSLWSYGKIDPLTYKPITNITQFNGTTGSMEVCLAFQDANASRVGIKGINFSAGTPQNPTPTSIDGEFVEIAVYEWTDVFTIIDLGNGTPDLNNVALDQISSAEYIYTSDLQATNVYAAFETPVILEDDKRYLFCLNLYSTNLYPGYVSDMDYSANFDQYLQPINMVRSDGGQFFPVGFAGGISPAMSINFYDAASANLVELPTSGIVAYPNPASEIVNIPHGKMEGNVSVTIIDINGRIIETQNSTSCSSTLTVDVSSLPTGMYTMKLTYEDGTSENIQVVVNR